MLTLSITAKGVANLLPVFCGSEPLFLYMPEYFRRPDCLANGFTDNQFRDFFCKGLLGEEQFNFGLDFQCKVRTGFSGSVACGVSFKSSLYK